MATASVLGWASVGFLTRCYQLGLQKRNIFESEYADFDAEVGCGEELWIETDLSST
jgi:hypothetical protein